MSSIIVQKFGGSCVADPARIKRVAERVAATRDAGQDVVVVVSAMGDTTDRLLNMAQDVSPRAPDREMDTLLASGEQASMALVAMAIADLGRPALSLSGSAAGIITDGAHGRARIVTVLPDRVRAALKEGIIVIVAGFQGVSRDTRDVTTLGRGGSDTTAVALAAALGARVCEIYTDVDGVHTADPRLVPQARVLTHICYEQMLELAVSGARVLMPRAVECARRYNVPLVVRSLSGHSGTRIASVPGGLSEGPMERPAISGVAHDLDIARMTVSGPAMAPGAAAAVLRALAADAVAVDMLVQNRAGKGDSLDLSFVLTRRDVRVADASLDRVHGTAGIDGWACDERVGKVSLVGVGVSSHPRVPATFFSALADADAAVMSAVASDTRLAAVCERAAVPRAVAAIHNAFSLERCEQDSVARDRGVVSAAMSECPQPFQVPEVISTLARTSR
jgi:aspartate kinase